MQGRPLVSRPSWLRRRAIVFAGVGLLVLAGILGALSVHGAGSSRISRPTAVMALIEQQWKTQLRVGARSDPRTRFPSPPAAVLRTRLREMQSLYGFQVEKVELLRPLQLAPLIILRTNNPRKLARGTPIILRKIDPRVTRPGRRSIWVYEGLLLEVRDQHNAPVFAVFGHRRGSNAGGGQWAVSEQLYPYPHGTKVRPDG